MFVSVQVDAVQAKAVEATVAYDKFMRMVGDDWDLVKGGLKITLGDWKEMETMEKRMQLLAARGLKDRDQQIFLAEAINDLLGIIREWRVQEGG